MNKKLLICGAIATVLLVSACVKKEAPKEDEQEIETTQTASSEPAQFENLPSAEQNGTQQVEAPAQVEIERTQTENTTTEIRRETHEVHATTQNQSTEPKPVEESKPAKAESVKTETTQAAPKATTGAAQSEDDAVAAAIAAATPALKN